MDPIPRLRSRSVVNDDVGESPTFHSATKKTLQQVLQWPLGVASMPSTQAVADVGAPIVCELCGGCFPSRNRLFKHIRGVHGLPATPQTAAMERVALIVAYFGHTFHGSACHAGRERDNLEDRFPTVEGTLLRQVLKGACWPPVRLSRCTRTDKGVHSLHSVVALDMPPLARAGNASWLEEANAALPTDKIRLLRRIPVSDFNARRLCDRRRYEYVLPYAALRKPLSEGTSEGETALQIRTRLKHALKFFTGTHDFTRFTCHGGYVKKNSMWRHVYRIHSIGNVHDEEDRASRYVVISICGRSFLRLQIRKMIGAVVAVMRGSLPPDWIVTALAQPQGGLTGDSPTAPAFPLYLAGASYERYKRRRWQPVKTATASGCAALADGSTIPAGCVPSTLAPAADPAAPPDDG